MFFFFLKLLLSFLLPLLRSQDKVTYLSLHYWNTSILFFTLILFIKSKFQNSNGTKGYTMNDLPLVSVSQQSILLVSSVPLQKIAYMHARNPPFFLFYTNGCMEPIVFNLKWKSNCLYRILTPYMNTLLISIKKSLLRN